MTLASRYPSRASLSSNFAAPAALKGVSVAAAAGVSWPCSRKAPSNSRPPLPATSTVPVLKDRPRTATRRTTGAAVPKRSTNHQNRVTSAIPPTENASTIKPQANSAIRVPFPNKGPDVVRSSASSAVMAKMKHTATATRPGQIRIPKNIDPRPKHADKRSCQPERAATLVAAVHAFHDLFQGGAGDDAFEAPDHDRGVLDEIGVGLVGAGAAVEALEDAAQAIDAPFHVFVSVEGDPHYGVYAQGVEVATFQGGKDVVVLLQDAVHYGARVGHVFPLEHKDVGPGDDLERLVLVKVTTPRVGRYHLEELRELRVAGLRHAFHLSRVRLPGILTAGRSLPPQAGRGNCHRIFTCHPLKPCGSPDRFNARE